MLKCPNCSSTSYAIEQPGTVLYNAKPTFIGYEYSCNHCFFVGKPSHWLKLAKWFFILGFESKYKNLVKAIWR